VAVEAPAASSPSSSWRTCAVPARGHPGQAALSFACLLRQDRKCRSLADNLHLCQQRLMAHSAEAESDPDPRQAVLTSRSSSETPSPHVTLHIRVSSLSQPRHSHERFRHSSLRVRRTEQGQTRFRARMGGRHGLNGQVRSALGCGGGARRPAFCALRVRVDRGLAGPRVVAGQAAGSGRGAGWRQGQCASRQPSRSRSVPAYDTDVWPPPTACCKWAPCSLKSGPSTSSPA
jgi:hypothetical protein